VIRNVTITGIDIYHALITKVAPLYFLENWRPPLLIRNVTISNVTITGIDIYHALITKIAPLHFLENWRPKLLGNTW
jgi:hypothetical protein